MFKNEKALLDDKTIDAYQAYVQSEIRSDLNSVSLGPGKLPTRVAQGLTLFGFCCLLVGILLIALRMQHVYFWDWEVQFVGPFFIILFLMCCAGATYFAIIATRRSNRFRRELYFHPLGDYGIAAVHKDDLVHQSEMKHDLKSGTNPHKTVKPSSEAYSKMKFGRDGHNNEGYHHGPGDPHRSRRPDDRSRRPDDRDRRRGPPPEGGRRPPDDRDRRRPPDNRYGPSEGRRGPPPQGEYRRGPAPDDRRRDDRPRGPPPEGYRPERRGPPPEGYRDERRGPPRDDRRGPPPDDRRGPPQDRRGSPPDSRRGPPRTHFVERSPDDGMTKVKLDDGRESESEL